MHFSNYHSIEEIHDGPFSILFKGVRSSDERPVLIKILKKESSLDELASLQSLKIDDEAQSPKILKPLEYLFVNQHLGFVYPDLGMVFLRVLIEDGNLDLTSILSLCIAIADQLHQLHQAQIYHQDLTPGNILVGKSLKEIRFIGFYGFEKAGKQPQPNRGVEQAYFTYRAPELLEDALDQVDHRADLYSLGGILYEFLARQIPFNGAAPSPQTYRPADLQPQKLLESNPDLPSPLIKVVEKLLQKNPQDRYQSAKNLSRDLTRILTQVERGLPVADFTPEGSDTEGRFQIPTHLYGVEENLAQLLQAFERISQGQVEVVLVEGKPGVGKTSLIESLREPVATTKGYFVPGSFEKIHKDTPYFCLQKALQGLVLQILAQDEQTLEQSKRAFQAALGKNAGVMVDFLPDLKFLLGSFDPLPKLDSAETQKRFVYACTKFFEAFAGLSVPIVIFLDNFHWADASSISFLQALLTDIESRYLLLVLVYREQTMFRDNLFELALAETKKAGVTITRLNIHSMTVEDTLRLLEDTVGGGQNNHELAEILTHATNGNPFFIKQLLQSFYDKELIRFNRLSNRWEWEVRQIRDAAAFGDVVSLMSDKLKTLPQKTLEVLKQAACLGVRFDLKTLSWAVGKSKGKLYNYLAEAIQAGLLAEEMEFRDFQDPNNQAFHFTHSRIHQATMELFNPAEKKQAHLKIGRHLLKHTQTSQSDQLFTLVGHLNQGLALVTASEERHQLAKLNLQAGINAKAAAAYETAWRYYTIGVNLLSEDSWQTDYELTKELFLRGAESEYYSGNVEAAIPYFEVLKSHVQSEAERLEVEKTKLNLYIQTTKHKEAIELGIQCLQHFFNETIPPNEAELTIRAHMMMMEIEQSFAQSKIENLPFMGTMPRGQDQELMQFISLMLPAAYLIKRNLWVVLTLTMVRLTLEKGNSAVSPIAYMNYAVLLCSGLEDYAKGYAVAEMALRLAEKYESKDLLAQLYLLFGAYISHWRGRARGNIGFLKKAMTAGMNQGDLHTVAEGIEFSLVTKLFTGQPLEELRKEVKTHLDFTEQIKDPELFQIMQMMDIPLLLCQSLDQGQEPNTRLEHQDELLESLKKQKNTIALQWFHLLAAMIEFHLGKPSQALTWIQASDKLIGGYSQLAVPEHYFYYSLILLSNYSHYSQEEKKRYWDILKNNRDRLQNFAEASKVNFEDKYLLIAAEMAGVAGNPLEAMNLYDAAIKAAQKNHFIQVEALILERAALYFLQRKKETIAKAYLQEAYHAYIKWGARAKVTLLERKYFNLLRADSNLVPLKAPHKKALEPLKRTMPSYFDLSTLYKAFESISLEISFEKILANLFRMILENSGAQKGYFLVEQKGALIIRAKGSNEVDPPVTLCSFAYENSKHLSHKVISYVQRTGKSVLLGDALKENFLGYDAYIQKERPKSILALPIAHHSHFIGILYLENNRVTHAFSHEKVEFLTLLNSLVAITMENSSLYADLANSTLDLSRSKQSLEEKIVQLEQQLKQAKAAK